MLLYHSAGTPLLLPQMEKEIGIFAFPPNLIRIRPTGFRANSHLLYLREIHSSPNLEDDDDNEDHGGEGSNDDADDKRHSGRHSSLRLHLLLVPNLLFPWPYQVCCSMFDFLVVTYHTKYLKLTSSIRGLSVFELVLLISQFFSIFDYQNLG